MIFRAVEDADLIRQAARGNVEAYNLLVSRWEKRVYNYLLRITANREDALDLTQDVFLKAYQNLRKLDDPGRFAPWLYRIAHNEAYCMFRKRRPETDVDEIEPEATETEITVGGSSVFPIELSLAVASALDRLSAGPARSGGAQDLPGLQVRGDGRDSVLPGFHRQVPPVYRARTAQDRTGSREGKRCVMSCSPFDLRDYFLQELPSPQRRQVEAHVKTCPPCREELERLQLTEAALFSLRDEEIPQRIAFVSDQIFEPSPVAALVERRSGARRARLGFASAAMLSAAIIYFAATRPAPAPDRTAVAPVAAGVIRSPTARSSSRSSRPWPRPSPKWKRARPRRTRQLVADLERRATKPAEASAGSPASSTPTASAPRCSRLTGAWRSPSESGEAK